MEDTYTSEHPMLAAGESILWRGKPLKKAFVAKRCLSMMPIAIVWLCFDSVFLMNIGDMGGVGLFLVPFMLLHLMPVWIWLGSCLTAGRSWNFTNYYVTNRRIIIQGGILSRNEYSLYYKDIRNTNLNIGLFDKIFGTGTIRFSDDPMVKQRQKDNHQMEHLENPRAVYQRIQRIVLDIQTDMEYPNAYRPAHNPGYGTDYRP